VTGATGLLGNCIVRELYQRKIATRALCRPGTSRASLDGLELEIIEGDLDRPEVLSKAVQGCTAVIHSAAMIHIGWQKLEASRHVNVRGTQHIIDACLQHQVRMIHISTVDTLPAATSLSAPIDERGAGGIPKPACAYVLSKREAEQAVRDAVLQRGLDAVIVHPGFMLGPYDWKPSSGRMFLEVVRAPVVAAPAGGCSLCDARQVAAACVNAIKRGVSGENYILAGENLSYRDLWQRMLAAAGRRKRVFRLGPAAGIVGRGCDLAHRWLPIAEGDINSAALAMGSLLHYYDSSKAQKVLNYDPKLQPQLLQETWQWLSAHQNIPS